MFIDSHSHLNFAKFENDYQEAIQKARDSDVRKIVNIGSNLETSKKAIEIAQEFPGVCFAACGLHPIHVLEEEFDHNFEKLVQNKEVVAIGETGLDYYRIKNDECRIKQKVELQAKSRTVPADVGTGAREKQKQLFIKHLELAEKLNKPVILHCRDAYFELLKILKDFEGISKIKKVLHCYDGNIQYLNEFLNINCLISFTGNVTYGDQRDEAIKSIPTDMLMIETDAPYLAPEPYRGKKNQPAYVIEVAKYIAKIKKIPLVELEKILEQTTQDFFKI